ncbi:hypothetical protein DMENIID0001_018450 [Sergentomyia squamirostris]
MTLGYHNNLPLKVSEESRPHIDLGKFPTGSTHTYSSKSSGRLARVQSPHKANPHAPDPSLVVSGGEREQLRSTKSLMPIHACLIRASQSMPVSRFVAITVGSRAFLCDSLGG